MIELITTLDLPCCGLPLATWSDFCACFSLHCSGSILFLPTLLFLGRHDLFQSFCTALMEESHLITILATTIYTYLVGPKLLTHSDSNQFSIPCPPFPLRNHFPPSSPSTIPGLMREESRDPGPLLQL